MKKLIFLFIAFSVCACTSLKQVGDLNMISTRNIDSKTEYVLLKSGSDASNHDLRKNKAANMEQAVNNLVLEVPGGEFLKNVRVYSDGKHWAMKGDVWGLASSANVEGFKIGDHVMIKNSILNINKEKYSKGIVTAFKDKKACLVKLESGEIKAVDYSDLSKTDN